jgi:riboflavin kinase, archaea type
LENTQIEIKGIVTSGLNRGAKFLAHPVYNNIFTLELGKEPFLGTLNLIIDRSGSDLILDKIQLANEYDNLWYQANKLGGLLVLGASLQFENKVMECVIVRPKLTTHEFTTIEIVAIISFKNNWGINNGDQVIIKL